MKDASAPKEQSVGQRPLPDGPRFCEQPIRNLAEFTKQPMISESLVRVQGARVVFVDHEMLQHDFPELRTENLLAQNPALRELSPHALHQKVRELIESWFLRHTAYISSRQASQTEVNSNISISPSETVEGWRAPDYGRAAVLPIPESCSLIDVKGIGVGPAATPSQEHHSNGLLSLAEGLAEVLFEQLLCAILQHTEMQHGVVPHYGLVDLGFEIRDLHGNERACLLARRAHTRPPLLWGNEPPGLEIARLLMELELALRQFGITSVRHATTWSLRNRGGVLSLRIYRTWREWPLSELEQLRSLMHLKGAQMSFGGVNIQFTSAIECAHRQLILVDFGAYNAQRKFSRSIFSSAQARYSPIDGEIVLSSDPRFIQPKPEQSVPVRANTLPDTLAGRYSMGKLSGEDLRRQLDRFVSHFAGQLRALMP